MAVSTDHLHAPQPRPHWPGLHSSACPPQGLNARDGEVGLTLGSSMHSAGSNSSAGPRAACANAYTHAITCTLPHVYTHTTKIPHTVSHPRSPQDLAFLICAFLISFLLSGHWGCYITDQGWAALWAHLGRMVPTPIPRLWGPPPAVYSDG